MEIILYKIAFLTASVALAMPVAAQPTSPVSGTMTAQQITAFNQAVTDFKAAQTAQQAGNNAGALAKYEIALPAIRAAVQAKPTDIDNVTFLANALYAAAAANGALNKPDAMLALFDESLPYWRTVVTSKPANLTSQRVLAGILLQLATAKLIKQDKAGATILYDESITNIRRLIAANPTDAPARNMLLSALIGNSQASSDPKFREEAVTLSKAMLADGSVDAANKPNAQILAGTAQTK
jgi:tetratricopeptide (TPR) repeat protein